MPIKSKKNIFYAQSGGVTPVINATAKGIYDEFKKYTRIHLKNIICTIYTHWNEKN